MTFTPYKKLAAVLAAGSVAFTLAACGSDSESAADGETTQIRVGTSPGPYSELFRDGIDPILTEQGYDIDYTEFADLLQADVALSEGAVDLNVDQHTAYMNVFNDETGSTLDNITDIPTVATKIYSNDLTSLDDVADGQTVGIPADGSNQTRAFRLLIKLGWITVNDDADQNLLTPSDIEDNPHNLDIQPMDSATIPRALGDLDWGVIPGSIAYSSQVDPALALEEEDLTEDLILQAVTTEGQVDSDWAKAVAEAYRSEEFLDFVAEQNEDNYWFIPESLQK
ncbi:MetQ/NlpA family ABC transporter substrate-binding protein [Corynebacterium stationis]|uniref:MetQ/NlpA family ABC transporter substrate-binding protein n=1 Tax=Corynebacterium stationis TaxID=1705 RepID=UPI00076F809F|nr:MetQ/NlpA family ABC transporter substrate-binding protein [Corynebacterium stationis]AMJ45471.1 metal ABC transporter substrate-binding protein [Corynebacterium stationis]ASJ19606.1 metal ABC transporter substrate-binding protein [Corynebacterium stationis]HJG63780.1 MetQ/NlpA family ABC transporter substrate-binding protein [Corynebacterium stationis]